MRHPSPCSERCYWVTPTGSDDPVKLRLDVSDGEPTGDELQELADWLDAAVKARMEGWQ